MWKDKLPLLLLLLLGLMAVMPFWTEFARLRVPEPDDDWDNQLLLVSAQRESLLDYQQLPLWNRYPEGGSPLLANPESSIANPLSWLTLPLEADPSLRVQVVLHMLIGLVSGYLLLRALQISREGSAYGAGIYMLSSLFAERMQVGHLMWMGMAWLPLVIRAGIQEGRAAQRWAGVALALMWLQGAHYLVIFGSVSLFLLLAADGLERASSRARALWRRPGWQVLVLSLLALLIAPWLKLTARPWLLLLPLSAWLRAGSASWRPLKSFVQIGTLAAALSAIKLLPALELLAFSSRFGNPELEPAAQPDLLTGMGRWIGWVARDAVAPHEDQPTFWHLAPLLFALIGISAAARRCPRMLLLSGAAIVWSLGPNHWISMDELLQAIPGISLVRYPGRAAVLTWLSIAVLAGLGVDSVREKVGQLAERAFPHTQHSLLLSKMPYFITIISILTSALFMAHRASDLYGGLFVAPEDLSSNAPSKLGEASTAHSDPTGGASDFARIRCLAPAVAAPPTGENSDAAASAPMQVVTEAFHRQSMFSAFRAGNGCVDGFSAVPLVNARNVKARGDSDYRGEVWLEGTNAVVKSVEHTPNRITVTLESGANVTEASGAILLINQSFMPGWTASASTVGSDARSTIATTSERGLLALHLDGAHNKYVVELRSTSAMLGAFLSFLTLVWLLRSGFKNSGIISTSREQSP